jgi:hypothetical protein
MKKKYLPIPALLISYVIMPTVTMWLVGIAAVLFMFIVLIVVAENFWID